MANPGDPPRHLTPIDSGSIVLGHRATLLGSLALAMASALIWTFLAGYGIGFKALLALAHARVPVAAKVESSQPVQLWNGEPAHRTTALFSYQGATFRAAAYGLPAAPLKAGQAVTVVMPEQRPDQAWILGLQKFPLRISAVAQLGALSLLPGLILTLWGLGHGARQRRMVRMGSAAVAQRTGHWGLPRPMSDLFLDRFAYSDAKGVARSLWSIGRDGPEQEDVLVMPSGGGALVVGRLLPQPGQLTVGPSRRLAALLVLALALGQIAVVALFMGT